MKMCRVAADVMHFLKTLNVSHPEKLPGREGMLIRQDDGLTPFIGKVQSFCSNDYDYDKKYHVKSKQTAHIVVFYEQKSHE